MLVPNAGKDWQSPNHHKPPKQCAALPCHPNSARSLFVPGECRRQRRRLLRIPLHSTWQWLVLSRQGYQLLLPWMTTERLACPRGKGAATRRNLLIDEFSPPPQILPQRTSHLSFFCYTKTTLLSIRRMQPHPYHRVTHGQPTDFLVWVMGLFSSQS